MRILTRGSRLDVPDERLHDGYACCDDAEVDLEHSGECVRYACPGNIRRFDLARQCCPSDANARRAAKETSAVSE